jgi:hypothetical protein
MTLRRTIELVAFALALLIAAMALHAWLASRDDQQRLATTLSQQKQLLDAADTREHARQSALNQKLDQIEKLKRATQTPQQIISAIPQFISLPQPITFTPNQQGTNPPNSAGQRPSPGLKDPDGQQQPSHVMPSDSSPDAALPSAPEAQIPTADLKPLYNYIQDCRACQALLAAAKQNASDDASKITALTTERDAAMTAAKGGTFWHRLRSNALWFAIGAATTAAARTKHADIQVAHPVKFLEQRANCRCTSSNEYYVVLSRSNCVLGFRIDCIVLGFGDGWRSVDTWVRDFEFGYFAACCSRFCCYFCAGGGYGCYCGGAGGSLGWIWGCCCCGRWAGLGGFASAGWAGYVSAGAD